MYIFELSDKGLCMAPHIYFSMHQYYIPYFIGVRFTIFCFKVSYSSLLLFCSSNCFTPSPSTELACFMLAIVLQIVLGLLWVRSQYVFVYFDKVFACSDLTPTLFCLDGH